MDGRNEDSWRKNTGPPVFKIGPKKASEKPQVEVPKSMFGAVKKTGPPVFTNSGKNRRALNEGKGSDLSEKPPLEIPESGKSPSETKH